MNRVIFSPPSCRSSLYEGRVGGVCGSSSASSQQQLPASARGRSAPSGSIHPVLVLATSCNNPLHGHCILRGQERPGASPGTTSETPAPVTLWHAPQLLWVRSRSGAGQSDPSYPTSSRSIVARCSEVLVLSTSWNIYLVMAPWISVAIFLFQLNNAVLNNIKL